MRKEKSISVHLSPPRPAPNLQPKTPTYWPIFEVITSNFPLPQVNEFLHLSLKPAKTPHNIFPYPSKQAL